MGEMRRKKRETEEEEKKSNGYKIYDRWNNIDTDST